MKVSIVPISGPHLGARGLGRGKSLLPPRQGCRPSLVFSPPSAAKDGNVRLKNMVGAYDPESLEAYFKKRPLDVVARLMSILSIVSAFAARKSLLWLGDTLTCHPIYNSSNPNHTPPTDEQDSTRRASSSLASTSSVEGTVDEELAPAQPPAPVFLPYSDLDGLMSELGPCFVKLGQTLSTRADIVGDGLANALSRLQDRVPPFANADARQILGRDLGIFPDDLFVGGLPKAPIAAASLGQVYKAQLRSDGTEVAVKVQREDLLQQIAVDIFILRALAVKLKEALQMSRDLGALVDELGRGLFDELDYRVEAANAEEFRRAHAHLNYVTVPRVLRHLTSARVLTTEWAPGVSPRTLGDLAARRPLSPAAPLPFLPYQAASVDGGPTTTRYVAAADLPPDVARAQLLAMVDMGVRCSLTQLLETGVMHADPHPGNLLLTAEGRLTYLDFGLLTRVVPEHREAMMGAVVHLVLGRWDELVKDFRKMEILKPETNPRELADDLRRQFLKGAPADATAPTPDSLTFKKLTTVLVKLALKYKFKLPPYYTLVVRSLATLEGIALQADPDFKILKVAFPVVLERLIFDNRRGARALLRELLFGPEGLRMEQAVALGKIWLGAQAQVLVNAAAETPSSSGSSTPSLSSQPQPPLQLNMALLQRAVQLALSRRASPLRRAVLEADPKALIDEALKQPKIVAEIARVVGTFGPAWALGALASWTHWGWMQRWAASALRTRAQRERGGAPEAAQDRAASKRAKVLALGLLDRSLHTQGGTARLFQLVCAVGVVMLRAMFVRKPKGGTTAEKAQGRVQVARGGGSSGGGGVTVQVQGAGGPDSVGSKNGHGPTNGAPGPSGGGSGVAEPQPALVPSLA